MARLGQLKVSVCLMAMALALVMGGPSARADDIASLPVNGFFPDRTLAYVVIGDASSLQRGLEQTALWKIYEEPDVQTLIAPILSGLAMGDVAVKGETGLSIYEWRMSFGSIALGLLDLEFTPEMEVQRFQLALVGEMTSNQDVITNLLLGKLTREAESGGTNIRDVAGVKVYQSTAEPFPAIAFVDSYVVVGVGAEAIDTVLATYAGATTNISDDADFQTTARALGTDHNGLIAFARAADFLDMLQTILQQQDEEAASLVTGILDSTGLTGMRTLGLAIWADPPGVREAFYVGAPAPRKGLLGIVKEGPLSPTVLANVPADVSSCSASRSDMASAYTAVLEILESLPEGMGEEVSAALAQFETDSGINPARDIFPYLEGEGVSYSYLPAADQPMTATPTVDQAVFMKLTDSAALAETLAKLETYLQDVAGLTVETVPFGTRQFQYIALGELFPMPVDFGVAYTIESGYLIAAFSPTTMKNVLSWADDPGKSILENEDFTTVMARLPEQYSGIDYVDFKNLAGYFYTNVLPIVTMGMAMSGIQPPLDLSTLPPAEIITQHLFGLGNVVNVDDDGISCQTYSPTGMLPVFGGIAAAAGFTAMQHEAMPGAAVEPADCQRNLKRLAIAATLYAYDHDNAFPDTIEEMADYYDRDPSVLHCPVATVHEEPSDYAIVSGLSLDSPPDSLLLYEINPNHGGRHNVAFAEGRVEQVSSEELQQLLGETPAEVQ